MANKEIDKATAVEEDYQIEGQSGATTPAGRPTGWGKVEEIENGFLKI